MIQIYNIQPLLNPHRCLASSFLLFLSQLPFLFSLSLAPSPSAKIVLYFTEKKEKDHQTQISSDSILHLQYYQTFSHLFSSYLRKRYVFFFNANPFILFIPPLVAFSYLEYLFHIIHSSKAVLSLYLSIDWNVPCMLCQ